MGLQLDSASLPKQLKLGRSEVRGCLPSSGVAHPKAFLFLSSAGAVGKESEIEVFHSEQDAPSLLTNEH